MPAMPVDDPGVPLRRPASTSLDIALDRTPVRKLEFVDIDPTPVRPSRRRVSGGQTGAAGASATTADAAVSDAMEVGAASSMDPGEPRWSLWGDAEV